VLVQGGRIPEAIALLEKLLIVEPKRARELYQRMAQYALQLYKDEDAIRYAARAVELNPDDAEGHRRLGGMYKSRQDNDRAIAEFRAAISKNDRLFIVYFELADLLLAKAQVDDRKMAHFAAIIDSMTPGERENPKVLNGSRRARIARGSGRPVSEVNQLVRQFQEMQKMMKRSAVQKLLGGLK